MFKDRFSGHRREDSAQHGGCSWFSHLIGIGLATAAGLAVGFLFAPKSGEKMREDLKSKKDELIDAIEDIFGEFNAKFQEKYLDIKDDILDEINALKNKAELTRDGYREIIDEVVEKYFQDEKIPKDMLERLKNNLLKDWHDLRKKLRS